MSKAHLFSPLKLRKITVKNRIGVSPMCMYSSQDGYSSAWHLVHLGSRAVGGAGLVLTEATAVSPEGRITPRDLGIWKADHIHGLQEITTFIKAQGSVPGIQLAHAGRKASTTAPWEGGKPLEPGNEGWVTQAPSAVPFREGDPIPNAMDQNEIDKLVDDFSRAAERALEAGFQVLEIHAAHGYLLHEFLSPLSNFREDNYGGSFENRIRLTLEVVRAVRQQMPEHLPLLVRISATDWVDGGWNLDQSVALAKELFHSGVDLIDCSSGGLVPHAVIPVTKGYQKGFAAQIKADAKIPTAAVGLITEADEAEAILSSKEADLIFLGREFLRDPYFPLRAATQLDTDVSWPRQYERAKPRIKG